MTPLHRQLPQPSAAYTSQKIIRKSEGSAEY